MTRSTITRRRVAAAAALSALCFGFSLPATASNTAVEASADGDARAAEARGDVEDTGGFFIAGISWK